MIDYTLHDNSPVSFCKSKFTVLCVCRCVLMCVCWGGGGEVVACMWVHVRLGIGACVSGLRLGIGACVSGLCVVYLSKCHSQLPGR